MRGGFRRWFWLFFASGDFRHWQISPVELEAVAAQGSIVPALSIARDDAFAFERVQVVANRLFALAGIEGQLLYGREA